MQEDLYQFVAFIRQRVRDGNAAERDITKW